MNKAADKRLMLIDANSLLYRAFFALPPLENSKGQPTGAVYGFINMLLKLKEQYPSQAVVAAFDVSAPTRRQQQYSDYKAHRPPTPPELRTQFHIAKEVLTAMGIPQMGVEGYEADDVIATMAARAEQENWSVVIVSGDKDVLQLAGPTTKVVLTQKGISQTKEYDGQGVRERYGVDPVQLIDVKGFMGDASDNIPGVPGVGEKTALKLIGQHGSMEDVYQNLGQYKGKLRENLESFRQQAEMSRELARIDQQVPLEVDWPPTSEPLGEEALYSLFKNLEFNSLLEKLELGNSRQHNWDVVNVSDREELAPVFKQQRLAVLLPKDGAIALGAGSASYVCDGEMAEWAKEQLASYVNNPKHHVVTDDAKGFIKMAKLKNWQVKCPVDSCQLAGYLLRPGSNLSVQSLVRSWTDTGLDMDQDRSEWEQTAAHGALLLPLWDNLEAKLTEDGLMDMYSRIELPLAGVLAGMELDGVALDMASLDAIGAQVAERIGEVEKEIFALAGREFNIGSPKQLSEVLFDELELPSQKKTKTGHSTDISVLEGLMGKHEIIPLIIDYRQLSKLQSTYVQGLKDVYDQATGRVYTTFNQTVTATGRLSSTEPNMQNIPIRLEEGRKIRKAFVPGKGYDLLLAADYSQIELRILADMANDTALKQAFSQGKDIHSNTAAEIFSVDIEEVTSEQRRAAKAVNFGLVYGQTDYGLSQALGISRAEAREYIEIYFQRYPGVRDYMKQVVKEARENGYVSTMLGRRRYLPEIASKNFQRRSFAERMAINTPIQGTAADIIKLAMVEVEGEIEKQGYASRMLLQVHDELVFETTDKEIAALSRMARELMENVVSIKVPLVVDVKKGKNWYTMETVKE